MNHTIEIKPPANNVSHLQQKYLEEALLQYNMQGATAKLIRHNENMTFQVANEYLLRIHKHVEGISNLRICLPMIPHYANGSSTSCFFCRKTEY